MIAEEEDKLVLNLNFLREPQIVNELYIGWLNVL